MEHPTLKFPLIPKLALGCAKEAGNQIFGNVQRGSHAARSRRNGNGTMLTVHKTAMQCWGASTAECSGGRTRETNTRGRRRGRGMAQGKPSSGTIVNKGNRRSIGGALRGRRPGYEATPASSDRTPLLLLCTHRLQDKG